MVAPKEPEKYFFSFPLPTWHPYLPMRWSGWKAPPLPMWHPSLPNPLTRAPPPPPPPQRLASPSEKPSLAASLTPPPPKTAPPPFGPLLVCGGVAYKSEKTSPPCGGGCEPRPTSSPGGLGVRLSSLPPGARSTRHTHAHQRQPIVEQAGVPQPPHPRSDTQAHIHTGAVASPTHERHCGV